MHRQQLRTGGVALAVGIVVLALAGVGAGLAISDAGSDASDGEVAALQGDQSADELSGDSDVAAQSDNTTETPVTTTGTATETPDDSADAETATESSAADGEESATDTPDETDAESSTATPAESTTDESAGTETNTDEAEDEDTTGADSTENAGSAGADADSSAVAETETRTNATADENGSTDASGDISSCTVIDEAGEYELTADVSGSGTCLDVRAGDVVLDGNGRVVAGSGDGTGIRVSGDGVANVTVRDVEVSDWSVAVQVGGGGGSDATAELVDVTAVGSDTGVRIDDADDSALREVTARDNRNGVVLAGASGVRANGLRTVDNEETGLLLERDVTDSSFSTVQATNNGDRGIRVASGSVDNFVGDATVLDNGGPGVEFSDSSGNVLADSRVEENGGSGVLNYPAGGDRLENVVLRGNGDGAYRDQGDRPGAVGETVHLGDAASVTFDQGVTHFADAGEPSGLPDGTRAVGTAVDVTLRETSDSGTATVTVPVDASGDVAVYQRVDGTWQERTAATVTDGEADVQVARSGVVVPVVRTTDGESGTAEGDGDTVRVDASAEDESAATGSVPTDDQYAQGGGQPVDDRVAGTEQDADANSTSDGNDDSPTRFEIRPAANESSLDYAFEVDGSVTKVTEGDVTADENDTVYRTNGTATVNGTTNAGDAYLVDGDLRQVRQTAGSGFEVRYDGVIGTNATES